MFLKNLLSFFNISNLLAWDVRDKNAKIRLLLVTCCFALFFCGLSYRLIIVATNGYVKSNDFQPKRNNFRKEIVDRNGNLLAVNLPSSSLFANPQKVIDAKLCLEKLAKILPNIDKTKLLAELTSNKTFIWIKRDLVPKEHEAIFNLGLPGFDFEQEQKRVYTFSNLLSHVIGYVGRDFAGLAGLERSFDKFLTNSELDYSEDEQRAKPLILSIDVRLQNILNEEIEKTLKEVSAIGAVGIIANPNNGEILAMVSKPDFDPHHPSKALPEQLFNMASLGIYETGSVFKSLTMAVAFDTDVIQMNDAYDLTYLKVQGFQISDYHPKPGWHSIEEIFLYSSNIGTSQIMFDIGKNNFKAYLKKLGLLDQLRIELPERGTPLFPSDKRWSDLTTATMSYGYAISISPLHFVRAMLPAVNGGILHDLTLIKRNEQPKTEITDISITKPLAETRIFKETTSKSMNQLFRFVVKEGIGGKRAEVKGYLVGGKTGTSEKLSSDGQGKRRYLKNSRVSSFFGVLPTSNPQYVIYIMFDEPKGTKASFGFATAAWNAAPTVGRVLERLVSLYGIEAFVAPEVQ